MRTTLAVLAVALLVAAEKPKPKNPPSGLPGTWVVLKAGSPKLHPSGGHWEFGKDKIALYRSNKVLDGHATYKADASGKPKTIDIVLDGGPAKGKTLKGIYE